MNDHFDLKKVIQSIVVEHVHFLMVDLGLNLLFCFHSDKYSLPFHSLCIVQHGVQTTETNSFETIHLRQLHWRPFSFETTTFETCSFETTFI